MNTELLSRSRIKKLLAFISRNRAAAVHAVRSGNQWVNLAQLQFAAEDSPITLSVNLLGTLVKNSPRGFQAAVSAQGKRLISVFAEQQAQGKELLKRNTLPLIEIALVGHLIGQLKLRLLL
ncbi:hypothetical protein WDV93_14535 [Pantoea ananatis]